MFKAWSEAKVYDGIYGIVAARFGTYQGMDAIALTYTDGVTVAYYGFPDGRVRSIEIRADGMLPRLFGVPFNADDVVLDAIGYSTNSQPFIAL